MTRETLTYEHATIPQGVLRSVRKELDNIGYESPYVLRKSLNPDDGDRYVVFAKKKDKEVYAFWSCYDYTRQTLNHGHYGYTNFDKCFDDALEFVN